MSDDFDIKALRIDPAKFAASPIPAKIRKRREQFVQVPMWWLEKLRKTPRASATIHQVACYLCHLDWKHHRKPFKLANGMLNYDGINRFAKWRALNELERRGLITIERQQRKSPIIHVHLYQDNQQ